MKLKSFSVRNFRSITKASKVSLRDYSLLIGANNEGKSNILHALALGMRELVYLSRSVQRGSRGLLRRYPSSRFNYDGIELNYNWDTDYPVQLQDIDRKGTTIITLEFELTESEIDEFRDKTKSRLNDTLPIEVKFSSDDSSISVRKQGRGHATLNQKIGQIRDFVAEKIQFEYIPSIRTAGAASYIVEQLVQRELREIHDSKEYLKILNRIEELHDPALKTLSDTITDTVRGFLPTVNQVRVKVEQVDRYQNVGGRVKILVDDGKETDLARKGDGVKSLVALALMRYVSEAQTKGVSTVIAIEEPEVHLHPGAIRELRKVIEALSAKNQVVLTSHSPLFVDVKDRENIIIVRGSVAKSNPTISRIREELGVQLSDNLHSAELMILCEGSSDVRALRPILEERSQILRKGFASGAVAVESLDGASKLRFKASMYLATACQVQCLLDSDDEGIRARDEVIKLGIMSEPDVVLCNVTGLDESELEDIYDPEVYGDALFEKFGVDPRQTIRGKQNRKIRVAKWSDRMRVKFPKSRESWSEHREGEVKYWLSCFAAEHPRSIMDEALADPIDNFIRIAESKLSG